MRAVQIVADEGLAHPLLVGRAAAINSQIETLGLRIRAGQDFTLVDQDNLPHYEKFWNYYHDLMCRRGMGVELAMRCVQFGERTQEALLQAKNLGSNKVVSLKAPYLLPETIARQSPQRFSSPVQMPV